MIRVKGEREVIGLAVFIGLLSWCVDAVIDVLVFDKGSFMDLLVLDVPAYEYFVRGVYFVFILILGLLISRTITRERKVSEEMRVRDSALASSVNAFAIADMEGRLTYVNHSFLRILGYGSEQEVLGMTALSFVHSAAEGEKALRELRERGQLITEFAAQRKDGSLIELDLSANLVADEDGAPTCMIASFTNITERKQLEKERDHLASFPRLNPNPVIELDSSGNIVFFNNAASEALRTSGMPEDIGLLLPEDIDAMLDLLRQKKPGKFYREVTINDRTFAESIFLSSSFGSLRIYTNDISLRKKAEEGLKKSRDELTLQVAERTAELENINQDLEKEKAQIKTTNVLLELFTQDLSRKEYLDTVVGIIQKWSGCCCFGIRVLDKNGNWPFEASTGFSENFLESQHLLTHNEHQCACILVATERPQPWDLPAMTKFGSFYSNDYIAFLRGFVEKERSGHCGLCVQSGLMSVAVVPVHYQGKVLAVIHMADEEPDMVPLSNVEFIETLTHIVGGAIYKFNAEEELRKSREQLRNLMTHSLEVRENERKTIAREIHDELGQMLTALKIDLSLIREIAGPATEVSRKSESMTELVRAAIKAVKRITTELRPGTLDYLSISEAIEWQAQEFEERAGISCRTTSIPDEIVLNNTLSINIFRIFQEILTNIANHAGATSVDVRIENVDGRLVLNVRDNGRGITDHELSNPGSFGIIGMRERVHFMGGDIFIEGVSGKGTTVKVQVPVKSEEVMEH